MTTHSRFTTGMEKWNGQKVSEEFIAGRERFASDLWKWLARNGDEVPGMGMG